MSQIFFSDKKKSLLKYQSLIHKNMEDIFVIGKSRKKKRDKFVIDT